MAWLGVASFPPEAPTVLGISLLVALLCKQRAAAARARGDCHGYLRWHTAWHLTLPIGAGVASQVLLDMPKDERAQWSYGIWNASYP